MVQLRNLACPLGGVRFECVGVEALLGPQSFGKGTLYITEQWIMWRKEGAEPGSFLLQYKRVTLHAVSRDPAVHSTPCLYLMLNGPLGEEEQAEGEEPLQGGEEEEEPVELKFVPDDPSTLEEMYKAVQDCTLLHPDPVSDMSEDEEESEEEEEEYEGFDLAAGGDAVPLGFGAGGGRLMPSAMDEQERQIGLLRDHFGARLNFVDNLDNGNGNGHGGGDHGGPSREELEAMFEDAEEEPAAEGGGGGAL